MSQILEQLVPKLGIPVPGYSDLASEIAKKVTDNMKKEKDKETAECGADWTETETQFVCENCLEESKRFDIPQPLKKFKDHLLLCQSLVIE